VLREADEKLVEVKSLREEMVGKLDRTIDVTGVDQIRHPEKELLVDDPQQRGHISGLDVLAGESNDLIQNTLRIPHAAVGLERDDAQRFRIDRNLLLAAQRLQLLDYGLMRHALEIEALAARQDRRRNLVRLGGGKNKKHPCRRLFQGLQKSVEGLVGEHVHFIDDINAVFAGMGSVAQPLAQVAHFVDAAVGGAVDLKDIEAAAFVDFYAGGAGVAGADRRTLVAVQGFG